MIFLFLIQSIFAGTFTQVTKTVVIPFKLSANLVLLHEVPIPGLELKGQIFTRGTFHEIQPNLSCDKWVSIFYFKLPFSSKYVHFGTVAEGDTKNLLGELSFIRILWWIDIISMVYLTTIIIYST